MPEVLFLRVPQNIIICQKSYFFGYTPEHQHLPGVLFPRVYPGTSSSARSITVEHRYNEVPGT